MNIETEKPFFGLGGNWTIIASHIKCWADAIGAMVWKLGGEAILAHSADEAADVLVKEVNKGKLAELQSEIRELKDKIWDLEEEMYDLEKEEEKLKAVMRECAAAPKPQADKNQLTLAF